MHIAIVGAGIAGLSASWALRQHHQITLFEAESRLGGHAHTTVVPDGFGGEIPVDTGFIVYNSHNYPNFIRLLDAIDAPSEKSDMSFAVSIGNGALEYFGDGKGMFAQRRNLFRPSHWRMIRDIVRFYKEAPAKLDEVRRSGETIGDLILRGGYSSEFAWRHLLPMAAAIWSTPVSEVNNFPAETFLAFFTNHQLFEMDLMGRDPWRTISGGSREYVNRIAALLGDDVKTGAPVRKVARLTNGRAEICTDAGSLEVDGVVFACHPGQALDLIGADARPGERAILGAIHHAPNRAVLHQDISLMPRRRRAWASWNYLSKRELSPAAEAEPVALTYWMNRLQNLDTRDPILLTLNPDRDIDPATIHGEWTYAHPQFSADALKARRALTDIQGADRFWFCGAWAGYGFHEDGCASGLAVAKALGAAAPWAEDISEMSPAAANATPRNPAMPVAAMAAE